MIQSAPELIARTRAIQEGIAAEHGITVEALLHGAKQRDLVQVRWLALHVARVTTGASLSQLDRLFRSRNGFTVYALRRFTERLSVTPFLRAQAARWIAHFQIHTNTTNTTPTP